jgi:hypothetical protein
LRSVCRARVVAAKLGCNIPSDKLQQATELLQGHHGTPRGSMGGDGPKQEWCCCKGCKGRDGKAFVNRASNLHCHLCRVPKSQSCGKLVPPKTPSKSVRPRAADAGEAAGASADTAKLQKEVKELKAKLAKSEAKEPDREEVEEGPTLGKEISDLHDLVALGRKQGKADTHPLIADSLAQIEELKAKRDAAKPVSQQLADAGREVSKLERKVEDREAVLEAKREAMLEAEREFKTAEQFLADGRSCLAAAKRKRAAHADALKGGDGPECTEAQRLTPEQLEGIRASLGALGARGNAMYQDVLALAKPSNPPPVPAPARPSARAGSMSGGYPVGHLGGVDQDGDEKMQEAELEKQIADLRVKRQRRADDEAAAAEAAAAKKGREGRSRSPPSKKE